MDRLGTWEGHVAALVTSHMNGLEPLERTKEQTTETITPSSKTITAAAMTTNRITSLRELLHYRYKRICNHPFQGRKSIAELPPALNLLVPICTPEWREAGTVTCDQMPSPRREQSPRPELEPGPLDPEYSALAARLSLA